MSRESVVVAKTVRLVAPLAVTFGLFTMFHGTKSVGGGFQGGVVVGATVVTIAFAFGVRQTWASLTSSTVVAAAVTGLLVFGLVALGSLALGGPFLDPTGFPVATVYVVELVEIGIGVTVAGAVVVLFFELAGVDDAG